MQEVAMCAVLLAGLEETTEAQQYGRSLSDLAGSLALAMGAPVIGATLLARLRHVGAAAIAVAQDNSNSYRDDVVVGASILDSLSHVGRLAAALRAGHESYDGSGWPHGLRAREIPLEARIVRVAEAYAGACTYGGLSETEATAWVAGGSGREFCPEVVWGLQRSLLQH